jgi:hypothetical protein
MMALLFLVTAAFLARSFVRQQGKAFSNVLILLATIYCVVAPHTLRSFPVEFFQFATMVTPFRFWTGGSSHWLLMGLVTMAQLSFKENLEEHIENGLDYLRYLILLASTLSADINTLGFLALSSVLIQKRNVNSLRPDLGTMTTLFVIVTIAFLGHGPTIESVMGVPLSGMALTKTRGHATEILFLLLWILGMIKISQGQRNSWLSVGLGVLTFASLNKIESHLLPMTLVASMVVLILLTLVLEGGKRLLVIVMLHWTFIFYYLSHGEWELAGLALVSIYVANEVLCENSLCWGGANVNKIGAVALIYLISIMPLSALSLASFGLTHSNYLIVGSLLFLFTLGQIVRLPKVADAFSSDEKNQNSAAFIFFGLTIFGASLWVFRKSWLQAEDIAIRLTLQMLPVLLGAGILEFRRRMPVVFEDISANMSLYRQGLNSSFCQFQIGYLATIKLVHLFTKKSWDLILSTTKFLALTVIDYVETLSVGTNRMRPIKIGDLGWVLALTTALCVYIWGGGA